MALEHNEIQAIKKEFFEEADERYVKVEECNDKQTRVNDKFAKDDMRIEIISHDFKVIKWLVTTVAATSIGSLVAAIFELLI